MTITQLEYIVAVDTYRHFATAADKCFVTQPTLSMQIHKVEDELDLKLFDRSKQPVVPTEGGKMVIEQARVILREYGRIKEIVKETKNEISGELRLGIIPTVAPYVLPMFITQFLTKYPKVRLIVEEMITDEILQRLANDSIDAGIVSTPVHEAGIRELPLYYEPIVAFVSKQHELHSKEAISADNLSGTDIWTLSEGHCFRNQVINLCKQDIESKQPLNLQYHNGSVEFLSRLAEMTGKVTILPELATSGWSEEKLSCIRKIENPSPFREISIVMQRNFAKQHLILALKDAIINQMKPSLLERPQGELMEWR